MSEDLKDWQKEAIKRAEESKNDTFESWIDRKSDGEGKRVENGGGWRLTQ